ncbi:uncharacterized protein LOC124283587 [Haliotis rubra]|uniref:uncharacterized protein LOC124283587 n=1 Tax=Haliotis rubra TaxID=36100 RepID=UPI001EE61C27|nr:uncharacterized protein LOC124283587 [Haliotis rubra]
MKLIVVVVVLLVYVVAMIVESQGDDNKYLLDVKLPPLADRDEDRELGKISQYIWQSYGIDDIYRFKVRGEPRAIVVVTARSGCSWNWLTYRYVKIGADFSVTTLYDGESLADDLGVTNTLQGNGPSSFSDSNLYFIEVTFAPGKTTPTALNSLTQQILRLRADLLNQDKELAFYKVLGQVPARILIFANLLPSKADSLYTTFSCTDGCSMKLTAIQSLRDYVEDC